MQGQQNIIDFLKTNYQQANRDQYLNVIRQTLSNQQPQLNENVEPVLQQEYNKYRFFMHELNFASHNKSNTLIEQALNNVHPGLKTKKECKVILSIMAKVFCQQLVEECVEIKQQYKNRANINKENSEKPMNGNSQLNRAQKSIQKLSNQIDIDIVEEAYRRRLLKKQKL